MEYVYTHIWVPHLLFQCIDFAHCHQVAQVAFRAEVVLVMLEVHPCLCISSLMADSLLCHFGKEGSHLFDFHESLLGVFLSLPSTLYAQETQILESSLHGLRREVSLILGAFPRSRHAKTLLWPFWPHSWWQGFSPDSVIWHILQYA